MGDFRPYRDGTCGPHDDGMNTSVTESWDEVGAKLNGLGLKLKLHVEQASGDERELKDALRRVSASIEDAFDGLRNAAKDPAVKEDVRDVGAVLSRAVSRSFSEVNADLRNAMSRRNA